MGQVLYITIGIAYEINKITFIKEKRWRLYSCVVKIFFQWDIRNLFLKTKKQYEIPVNLQNDTLLKHPLSYLNRKMPPYTHLQQQNYG